MSVEFEITEFDSLKKYHGHSDHIVIPDGVRFIEMGAFEISPKSMEFPESLHSISTFAFEDGGVNLRDENGYYIADHILFAYDGDDSDLHIPKGVEIIDSAFRGNQTIRTVELPESVKIVNGGFEYCENLVSVSMPGVIEIGDDAFSWCRSIERVECPARLKLIGIDAFDNCIALKEIVFNKDLETIEDYAFQECKSLVSVTIPDKVKKIERGAFNRCDALHEIVLNDSLESIGEYAFQGCESLDSIRIPDSVKKIGEEAFAKCVNLRRDAVILPQELVDENKYLYEDIGIPDNNGCIIRDGILEHYAWKNETAVVSEGVTTINEDAFRYFSEEENRPKRVCLPTTVRKAEDYALTWVEVVVDSSVFKTTEKLIKEFSGSLGNDPLNLAYVILFQSGKRWTEAIAIGLETADTQEVFNYLVELLSQKADACTDASAGRAVKFAMTHSLSIDMASKKKLYEVLQSDTKRWKKSNAAFEQEFGTSFDEPEDNAEHAPVQIREIEQYVREHYEDKPIYPEVVKVCNSGIHYDDNDSDCCSTQALMLLINEYVDEFYNVSHEVQGTMSVRRDIDDQKTLYKSEVADTIAVELNQDELMKVLKKLAFGRDYRKYLIAYARYGREDDIKAYCTEINKNKSGNAQKKYKAANMKSALYISDTSAAFEYLEKNGDIEKYAAMRGMTPDEYRNIALVPDFGLDENAVRRLGTKDGSVTLSVGADLQVSLQNSDGQPIKNLPRGSGEKEKEEFKKLKKDIEGFVKSRKMDILKLYLRNEALDNSIWMKSYAVHPILKKMAAAVIWADETGGYYTYTSAGITDIDGQPYTPEGGIRPAHVLDMEAEMIEAWQRYLLVHQRSLLFDQVWEPVVSYKPRELGSRYYGVELTNKERSALRTMLKKKGVDVKAGSNEGQFDHRQGSYVFSDTNTMFLGNSLTITYLIDEDTKSITFGKDLKKTRNSSKYEINAILFAMDKATLMSAVEKDETNRLRDEFLKDMTAAQILELIDVATANKAFNCGAMLQEYKNTHYPEYDAFSDFVLK